MTDVKNGMLTENEIQTIRARASAAIVPLKPSNRYFYGKRTHAGRYLPEYYLVYFLLVDLLGFQCGGPGEKVAWSIPVELDGGLLVIEHRKLGLGIFVDEPPVPYHPFDPASPESEKLAERVVRLVQKGIKEAAPFFDHLASSAASRSALNVVNNSSRLYERFEFHRDEFRKKLQEALERKNEEHVTEHKGPDGTLRYTETTYPRYELKREAEWLGIAAIEAFFSWTEHVLIHIAILEGKITTGEAVDSLAGKQWAEKVKTAIDVNDPLVKTLYDKLIVIRTQIRNYMAHGAFGKGGEAFEFHSSAGAVPMRFTEKSGPGRFSFLIEKSFDEGEALQTIDAFIEVLWSGSRAPAKHYLQDSSLPLVLTFSSNGSYSDAMSSEEEMMQFVEGLERRFDDAANMDW
jgi:hypothetical protein